MWRGWHKRLKAHKAAMVNPPADADLAAALADDPRVRKKVQRAAVNHWFTGRREPEISQFFVLCELLGADPYFILGMDKAARATPPAGITKHDLRNAHKPVGSVRRNKYKKIAS